MRPDEGSISRRRFLHDVGPAPAALSETGAVPAGGVIPPLRG
jgi:hypothetical protein